MRSQVANVDKDSDTNTVIARVSSGGSSNHLFQIMCIYYEGLQVMICALHWATF